MKFFRAILLAIILGGPVWLHAELADAIRVVVHDSAITSQEVEIPALALVQNLRRQYASQPELFKKKLDEALNDRVDLRLGGAFLHHYDHITTLTLR